MYHFVFISFIIDAIKLCSLADKTKKEELLSSQEYERTTSIITEAYVKTVLSFDKMELDML